MRLSLIVAHTENRVIGLRGGLPWHLPADLRFFRDKTTGHAVIMGRRTFEEVGKPLPNRRNIVVTRREGFDAEGVEVAHSLDEAIGRARSDPSETEAFIIGGGEIYRQAIPLVDRMYITLVRARPEGDTTFPKWNENDFELVSQTHLSPDERNEHAMDFLVYDRRA